MKLFDVFWYLGGNFYVFSPQISQFCTPTTQNSNGHDTNNVSLGDFFNTFPHASLCLTFPCERLTCHVRINPWKAFTSLYALL